MLPDAINFAQPKCSLHESTLADTRAIVLDNGVFTLSVLPEYGGRLCSLFYRPTNVELLATDFLRGPRNAMSVHGGWCAAFPSLLADGEIISHATWESEVIEQSDERVGVRLWCLVEQVSHMLEWQVRVTPGTILVERYIRLVAGEPAVTVEDVLTNRNTWPMSTTWSGMVSFRARPGDRVVLPVDAVEVQRGVGPSGNELDFGLLVSTPYQAMARHLHEGWLGFRPAAVPIDVRLTFPHALLPHAIVIAKRDEQHPAENAFRLQPLATPAPIADDTRGGALVLPPRTPVHLPIRLEAGSTAIHAGAWGRPGLQLAGLIASQKVPGGRMAAWRVGRTAIAVKTAHLLMLVMPEFSDDSLLTPEDMPATDLILCGETPPRAVLRRLAQRTTARFIGPAEMRRYLVEDGISEERAIALSPGARFDLPGMGILATPSRDARPGERLGFLMQSDHMTLYHPGVTEYLPEFAPLGQQFHPQLTFLSLDNMTMTDALNAAKLLQTRLIVPLSTESAEQEFIRRCRDQHVAFACQSLYQAEGVSFDGWRLGSLY